ncbi:MAG: hypothetical protein KIT27_03040 [Legionellales bacterium]|nr:hypothetical protein [Legionellales bacterium]
MTQKNDHESQLIPLYGFLQGDSLGLLILANSLDTVLTAAQKLQQAAAVRVPSGSISKVIHQGRELELNKNILAAGIKPLDRIDVVQIVNSVDLKG